MFQSLKLTHYPLLFIAILTLGVLAGAAVSFVNPLIAFAALIGVIGFVVLMRDALWGLYSVMAVVTLLPFAALPLNVGFSPTFLDLVMLMLVGVWLMQIAVGKRQGWLATPLDGPILIFLTLAFFSFIMGLGFAGLTVNVLRHFVEIISAIGLYFVVVNVLPDTRNYERTVQWFMLLGFVAALIGIVLYFIPDELAIRLLSALRVFKYPTGDGILRFIEDDPALAKRATATSVDPNVLGGLLILVTALAIPQLFVARGLFQRKWLAPMVGVMGVCLLLTFSRGSLLGVAVAAVVIIFLWLSRRTHPIMAAGITVISAMVLALVGFGLLLILPFTQSYAQHLIEGLQGQDRATLMRFGEYKDALTLIARYPFFGVGFSGVPDIDLYRGVSSVYLLMAEEMGLVGVSAFAFIIIVFFWRGWHAHQTRDFDAVLVGFMAAVLGALVGGIFDHYFFNLDFPHSVTLFWLCVGLGMRRAQQPVNTVNNAESTVPVPVFSSNLRPLELELHAGTEH
jgi:O-antigen ligase